MAYTKTNWVNDSVPAINATNLNHIEQGIYDNSLEIDYLTSYSTNETNTGKKWIDDKPVYRKVINFGVLPNATIKTVAHNINNLGTVIDIKGFAYNTSSNYYYPLPLQFEGDSSTYNVELLVNSTNIQMSSSNDRSAFTAYVIIEYTKSTD